MMTNTKKRLHVSKLEPIAQDVTRQALQLALSEGKVWITPEQDENLTLGTFIKDDICVFELYIATDPHRDGLIVSRVVVDRYSGEVIGKVEVYLPPVLERELPHRV